MQPNPTPTAAAPATPTPPSAEGQQRPDPTTATTPPPTSPPNPPSSPPSAASADSRSAPATTSDGSPPNALKEMPARADEKDLHDMAPRAVTMFGVQAIVFGHAIVARSEFSGIFVDHENGEIRLGTKNGNVLTTGLAPRVYAEFVLAQREQVVIVPGSKDAK